MIWESKQTPQQKENYTKHYVYEPNSFVPLLQTGYTGFIKLIETSDYSRFQHEPYSIYNTLYGKLKRGRTKRSYNMLRLTTVTKLGLHKF